MDLKTFFEHFDTLAEAPNGIQRLRELILDMAVRGKLVLQALLHSRSRLGQLSKGIIDGILQTIKLR